MWDGYEKRVLPFRRLKFIDVLHGEKYEITITKSLLPSEDLMKGVGEIILFLMLGMVLSLIVVNRQISKRIWTPFYDTISKLKEFKISKHSDINFVETSIYEFKDLNEVISKMLNQNKKDYVNLNEFTENASHEMQTPLAIIKSKSEVLLQDSSIQKSSLVEINKINEAASRLSKLKNGLSMLAKINNNQYEELEEIDLVTFLKKKLTYFEELIALKNITLTTAFIGRPCLTINYTLAYVLVNNLLNNAIKHNVPNGSISIIINEENIIFENSGLALKTDPKELFKRFKKDSTSIDSSGLGLAIVKKVCERYNMTLDYVNQEDLHRIVINFNSRNYSGSNQIS
jgi:signal transduction histidine kinase